MFLDDIGDHGAHEGGVVDRRCGLRAPVVPLRVIGIGKDRDEVGGIACCGHGAVAGRIQPGAFAAMKDQDRRIARPVGKCGWQMNVIERDEEKWNPVFLVNHATTKKLARDDVSIKHHPALAALQTLIGNRDAGQTRRHRLGATRPGLRPPDQHRQTHQPSVPGPGPEPERLPGRCWPQHLAQPARRAGLSGSLRRSGSGYWPPPAAPAQSPRQDISRPSAGNRPG